MNQKMISRISLTDFLFIITNTDKIRFTLLEGFTNHAHYFLASILLLQSSFQKIKLQSSSAKIAMFINGPVIQATFFFNLHAILLLCNC